MTLLTILGILSIISLASCGYVYYKAHKLVEIANKRLDQLDVDLNNLADTYYMCWKKPPPEGCKLGYVRKQ